MLEVQRTTENDGWCVSLNGTYVVGFFGPDARARAELHKDELATLLTAQRAPEKPPDRSNW